MDRHGSLLQIRVGPEFARFLFSKRHYRSTAGMGKHGLGTLEDGGGIPGCNFEVMVQQKGALSRAIRTYILSQQKVALEGLTT